MRGMGGAVLGGQFKSFGYIAEGIADEGSQEGGVLVGCLSDDSGQFLRLSHQWYHYRLAGNVRRFLTRQDAAHTPGAGPGDFNLNQLSPPILAAFIFEEDDLIGAGTTFPATSVFFFNQNFNGAPQQFGIDVSHDLFLQLVNGLQPAFFLFGRQVINHCFG